MQKLRPRAIIFDLGSTLIEYETVPWDELNTVCVEAARRFLVRKHPNVPDDKTFEEAFVRIRRGYREKAEKERVEWDVTQVVGDLLGELGIEHDDQLLDKVFDAYYGPVREQLYVFDDTVSTLEKVRELFPSVGLISNTVFPERTHLQEMRRFKINPYFDFTLFSSTFKLRKPHPDIFYKAANLAGFATSECLYIGDRYLEDVQGPEAVGMSTILKVKPGREYPVEMPETVRRIDTLSELFDHIEI